MPPTAAKTPEMFTKLPTERVLLAHAIVSVFVEIVVWMGVPDVVSVWFRTAEINEPEAVKAELIYVAATMPPTSVALLIFT